jgi:hypothetical protein
MHYDVIYEDGERSYKLQSEIIYHSPRYNKMATVPAGYISDGASGAPDLASRGWWVHDWLCDGEKFDDGSLCTSWQSSMILHDLLKEEGRWFRARSWMIATYLWRKVVQRRP